MTWYWFIIMVVGIVAIVSFLRYAVRRGWAKL
jgi:hypothetical protein